jgi:uncharacterized protein (DUF2384 family)
MTASLGKLEMLSPVVEAVRDGRHLDPKRLLDLTGMRIQDLAGFAGVDRNTVTRNPNSAKVQQAVGEIVRVLESATEVAGDMDRAVVWFRHQPIEAYHFKTPAELVAEGHVTAVLAYLDDLRHGTYA